MSLTEELDNLHAAAGTGAVVALTDLSSGIVLYARGDDGVTQEVFDDLCAAGCDAFDTTLGKSARAATGGARPRQAIVATAQEIRLFLRARPPATDLLCCALPPQTDIVPLIEQAHKVMDITSEA